MADHSNNKLIVLGAGMTGLGAGLSRLPIFEAAENTGGICSSYYSRLGSELAGRCSGEIVEAANAQQKIRTMSDWLQASFGQPLCDLFFFPFHNLYTAGLYREIVPQDAYNSPVNMDHVIQGTGSASPAVGYSTSFIYQAANT